MVSVHACANTTIACVLPLPPSPSPFLPLLLASRCFCRRLSHRHTLRDSYMVKPSMLPSYLPLRVADSILFVGKAMLLIRGQRATADVGAGRLRPPLRPTEDDYAVLTQALGALPAAVRGVFDAGGVARIVEDTHAAVARALWVVLNREVDLIAMVQVCAPTFRLQSGVAS